MPKRKPMRVYRPPTPRPARSTDDLDQLHREQWNDASREIQMAEDPQIAAAEHAWQGAAFTPSKR
jgi:hypothetical protein